MNRREFLAGGAAAFVGFSVDAADCRRPAFSSGRFRLNYAPHFGTFRNLAGDDPVDQIKFMADHGFTALEDVGMQRRPKCVLRKIRREMDRHAMTMGLFTATADFGQPTFTSGRRDFQARVLRDVTESLEVAQRVDARWMGVVPGRCDSRLPIRRQTANAVELLGRLCELCEPAGRVMLLEPLNLGPDRPGLFLRTFPQARAICRAVDSPACKILFDVYHHAVTAGNLIATIDAAWDETAYFQIGDSPGRKEPGTGSIDFRGLFRYLRNRGYRGLLGMEHGNSQPGEEGEQTVIDAYVAHDASRPTA